MKDLEKIKSEDLAAQVQDANPANFAIEQEVAQLVGATVPQPTEPSADDARELGAQLLVFLRRALLPIRSALRTAVAAIYAHLDSRCTDYTPAAYAPYQPLPSYDPMGTPPTPRTLPNLLTALTAFDGRKISNGSAPSDGIPDGVSLAQLVCGNTAAAAVLKIKDDTKGWTLVRSLPPYTNATEIELGCSLINYPFSSYADSRTSQGVIVGYNSLTKLKVSEMKEIKSNQSWNQGCIVKNCPKLTELDMSGLEYIRVSYLVYNCPKLAKVRFGALKTNFVNAYNTNPTETFGGSNSKLIDLELGAGTATNLYLGWWQPDETILDGGTNQTTFLQNFKEHIALRLTSNGSGKTLTLSQAVRDAIHAAEATYGIEAIIVTQKGWRIQPDAS